MLESLALLSPDEQTRALHAQIGRPIKSMSIFRILEMRAAIATSLDAEAPIVRAALEVIDGQIALREIAGDRAWR